MEIFVSIAGAGIFLLRATHVSRLRAPPKPGLSKREDIHVLKYPAIPAISYDDKQKFPRKPMGIFVYIAGAGIAPALQGYEPRDVLLVHPAYACYHNTEKNQRVVIAFFWFYTKHKIVKEPYNGRKELEIWMQKRSKRLRCFVKRWGHIFLNPGEEVTLPSSIYTKRLLFL